MKRFFTPLMLAILLPFMAAAQTDDRDYLTALLEDNLSGAGRIVTITGFAGALSSKATVQQLTIADDQGIWITLQDVALDWNRADLLTGHVSVNSLTAAEIRLDRLPQKGSGMTAEAGMFSLPDLPVSLQIGSVVAEKLILGAPVLGEAIEARIDLSLSLADGQGAGKLSLQRSDAGPAANVSLAIDYTNASQVLNLDLNADEDQGGIVARLLGIPNAPQTRLIVQGSGPLNDFTAQMDLTSSGVPRLAGTMTLTGGADTGGAETGGADGARKFGAKLAGNMAPLFAPEYAAFFGDHVALSLDGTRGADGSVDISNLNLTSQALTLNGNLALAADGLPQRFDLAGRISAQDGAGVLLPLTTDLPVKISGATLAARFDAAQGNAWVADIAVAGLDRADMQVAAITLGGTGTIARSQDRNLFDAAITFSAEGVSPRSAALADALGSVVWGDAALKWGTGDGAVALTAAHINTGAASAVANGTVAGLAGGFAVNGTAALRLEDLAQASGLIGRQVSGAATVQVQGQAVPLTGAFDISADINGRDITMGIPEMDRPLAGASQIRVLMRRDISGITLRDLTVKASGFSGKARGNLAAKGSKIDGAFAVPDLSLLGANYHGALDSQFAFTGTPMQGTITVESTANALRIGQPQVDTLMRGPSTLTATIALADGALRLDRAELKNQQLEGSLNSAGPDAALRFDASAKIRNLGVVLPQFPGALILTGTVNRHGGGQDLNLLVRGPGRLDANIKGYFDAGLANNVQLSGQAQAALINAFIAPRSLSGDLRFDLGLRGKLALTSISGTMSMDAGRLADPALPFVLQGITARADVANGNARVKMDTDIPSGGRISTQGSIATTAPYNADLNVNIAGLHLRNPDLYDTVLDGQLAITGPLRGGGLIAGSVDLGKTEIQVPSSSFRSVAALPDLHHTGDTPEVRATRARAGLMQSAARAAPAFNLDMTVRAPSRVFIRGRGLDAELGGELRLLGNTNDVRPAGAFNLVQGRFEILGKRLDLDEVLLQLEGQLVPFIHIRATTENDDVTSIVVIDGPAIDPDVTFTSSPELPQEEVLAQLLFGQKIQTLSALQGIQLAGAIATLAGRGNGGIVARVRGALALDNLDIQSDATGATTLKAGKYISDKVYTEVTIGQAGQNEINLNLDVSKVLKLHTGLASDGNASIGLVIENNY